MSEGHTNLVNDHSLYNDDYRGVYTYDQNLINYNQMNIPPPPNSTMTMDVADENETFNMDNVYTNMPLVPQYTLQHCPQPPPGPPPVVLMDKNIIDPYMAAEISSIVHTLSSSQLIYLLASLKKFVKVAPSEARTFLIKNPQLTYALLHSQFLLGEVDKSVLNLSKIDSDIALLNKFERSKDLDSGNYHASEGNITVPTNDDRTHYNENTTQSVQVQPTAPASRVPAPHKTQPMGPLPGNAQPIPPPPYGSDDDPYRKDKEHRVPDQPAVADKVTIDDLLNQGVYPASAVLVEEVLKNNEILTNIQRATMHEMETWPEEQKQQVLAIKVALHLRGISVNL